MFRCFCSYIARVWQIKHKSYISECCLWYIILSMKRSIISILPDASSAGMSLPYNHATGRIILPFFELVVDSLSFNCMWQAQPAVRLLVALFQTTDAEVNFPEGLCVYIYLHLCDYVCMCITINMCIWGVYVCVYVHVNMCAHVYLHVYEVCMHICVYMHVWIHLCRNVCVCMCGMHMYEYVHAYVSVYICVIMVCVHTHIWVSCMCVYQTIDWWDHFLLFSHQRKIQMDNCVPSRPRSYKWPRECDGLLS